ncbi:MAG TPA: CYTH domain-containing protein [Bryobacteraceae bacterium]|nr:CYTH domain-containing protein [Bryobacteraceae bacterium]
MGREIERKFLVQDDSWRQFAESETAYVQGYISVVAERIVRVRLAGKRAFLTLKGRHDQTGRDEFEYPLPVEDARQILETMCLRPLIEKTRYIVRDGGLKWEIDEFGQENRGLVIAEVELDSVDQEVRLPAWVGDEVTHDYRYSNASLVKEPYTRWSGRD